ncbi:MAG TPA: VOC family protein [Chloroflexota bacterium]|nr:VOC family protein [Chloroflexota bacterium]
MSRRLARACSGCAERVRPRFNHVALRVRDVARSLAFYEGVLGFREAFRVDRTDGSLGLIYVQFGPDQFVELFEGGDEARQPEPHPKGSGFLHFCLTVEDLPAALAELREKGLTIGEPYRGTSGALIYFVEDPDGNKIELAEMNERSETRQAAAKRRWLEAHGA